MNTKPTPNAACLPPTTQELHQVIAMLLHKLKISQITITEEDLTTMPEGLAITAEETEAGLELRLVDLTTAREFACSQVGDLP